MGRPDRVAAHEPTKARQFAGLVGPFLLRRRKSDPGIAPELPAKTETDHLLGLTREQVVALRGVRARDDGAIERADEARPGAGWCSSCSPGSSRSATTRRTSSSRPAAGCRAARGSSTCSTSCSAPILAEGGSVLVFTQYVAMARLLEAHLAAPGVPHQFLHGGTPVRAARARWSRASRPASGVPVFLLSLKAGGTGLNLTRADHVIHFDRWWNPAVEDQATDRAYRIGQTRPVQVHRLITEGTVEERVAELLRRKRVAGRRRARLAARPRSPS